MSLKFLVVDDSGPSRFITIRYLQAYDVEIEEAQNGLVALEKIEETDFDLILMDLSMPKMSGSEALAKLKEDGKKVNAIVVSAKIDKESIDEVMELGAIDYIIKPCVGQNLIDKLNDNLDKLNLPLLKEED